MKKITKYLFLFLMLILSFIGKSQDRTEWNLTKDVSFVTNTEHISYSNMYQFSPKCYITDSIQLQTIIEDGGILFHSPIWTYRGDQYTMNNTIILYDVNNIHDLIGTYGLTDNVICIDSIVGVPKICTLTLRNVTYTFMDSICGVLTDSDLCGIAEPDYTVFSRGGQSDVSSNPKYSEQWGLLNRIYPNYDINAEQAWHFSTGAGIKVAVIDEGVDLVHIDLVNNLLPGYDCTDGETGGTNGGYGVCNGIPDSHGTYCAGIIGATNNDTGIVGVAYNSKIIPIRKSYHYMSPDSTITWKSTTKWNINAFRTAIYTAHADVISNSWAYSSQTDILDNVLDEAVSNGRNGLGCVVVFATGNESRDTVSYPASHISTIAVGAMNNYGTRRITSNYGEDLDVVAPGSGIKTINVNNDYISQSGTSMACPFVAGVAALMLSYNPALSWSQVKSIIRGSAYKLPDYDFDVTKMEGSWNEEVGFGLVDAYKALLMSKPLLNRYIQDTTFENGSNQEEFGYEIYAGSTVTNDKNTGPVVVRSGADVSFCAVNYIELSDGFSVEEGASFETCILGSPFSVYGVHNPTIMHINNHSPHVDNMEIYSSIDMSSFSIYPNPTIERLTISITEELCTAAIYNLSGQKVLQTEQTEVDVSGLPDGRYLLRAQTADGNMYQDKFIKAVR